MKYLKLELPGSPQDAEVEVTGLGHYANGQTHEVDDALAETYTAVTGVLWPEDGTLVIPQPTVTGEGFGNVAQAPVLEIKSNGEIIEDLTGASIVDPAKVQRVEGMEVPLDRLNQNQSPQSLAVPIQGLIDQGGSVETPQTEPVNTETQTDTNAQAEPKTVIVPEGGDN